MRRGKKKREGNKGEKERKTSGKNRKEKERKISKGKKEMDGMKEKSIYIYCHVVSPLDDRNKITTILVFELTVKEWPLRKNVGHSGDQMFVLGNLTRVAWHGKEEGRSQTIGWDPKTEVAPSSRQRKKEIRKLVVGQGSWRTEPKPSTPGKRRRKEYFEHEEAISSSQY